jgi:predicted P-loop ATPase
LARGAEDTPLNRAYGRKWLMAGVRRIMSPKVNQSISPGVKFDYMLVLEGPQGIGKSTALRILAGDEWFTDRLSFKVIDDQRKIIEVITGKLIVEMSELAGLPIREVEDVKNFLSRTHDTARLAYRREPEELARTAIFAGTTNSKFYLHDSENRRFWCVGCGELNLVQLAKDREQLWAEAVAAAYTDESLELPKELWEEANEVAEQRKIEDPRLEVWGAKLKGLVDDTTKQIMNQEVEVYVIDWPAIYNRVGLDDKINISGQSYVGKLLRQIMAQLGWQRGKFTDGKRWFWRKDKDDPYEF